jgi:hypothetical protein
MTGAELRAWRKRLGISTETAAQMPGESASSLKSKQAGRRRVGTFDCVGRRQYRAADSGEDLAAALSAAE